nr:MAG TPA: hypothetical protein [Caudoviricetes sp.]DAJ52295.1 MAG TPA: hypothetical protein [Caudoviricetes sp.]
MEAGKLSTKKAGSTTLSAYVCLYSLSVYHRVPYKSGTR